MRIVVSSCLVDFPYRYNAQDVSLEEVKALGRGFELIPFCPEVWAGMGVPREPIAFFKVEGRTFLRGVSSAKPFYGRLKRLVLDFLRRNPDVRVFILKSKSPSCGVGSAKLIEGSETKRRDGVLPACLKGKRVLLFEEGMFLKEEGFDEVMRSLYLLREFYSTRNLGSFHRRNRLQLRLYSSFLEGKLIGLLDNPEAYERILFFLLKRGIRRRSLISLYKRTFKFPEARRLIALYGRGALRLMELKKKLISLYEAKTGREVPEEVRRVLGSYGL